MERRTFAETKLEFDSKYGNKPVFESFVPIHLSFGKPVEIANDGQRNEQYYKWQLLYSLVYSGMYAKDYIGTEVHFPKGNKNSASIIFDAAIFDDTSWFSHYEKYHKGKDQPSLDWLRNHLIAVVEVKNGNGKDTETIWNQQLKAALKESENGYCLAILYDTERLHLFKKNNGKFLRLNENFNTKKDASTVKDLQLHLTDSYSSIPNFNQLITRINGVKIDRSKRKVGDLDIISGIYSTQLTFGISEILRTMDKVSLKTQRGYEILIQVMAMKIYDEKRSQRDDSFLEFYEDNNTLSFYITPSERDYVNLKDPSVQSFIKRMRTLYNKAAEDYTFILKRTDTETIVWQKEEHIRILAKIVEQFQDYSFVRSQKTDLYQIVFHTFASEFTEAEKGQFLTPIPIIDFLVKIVNPRSGEQIIDPTSGIADFLSISYVNSGATLQDCNIYGLDNDAQMVMLAQLNMLLNGDGNARLKCKPDKGSIVWKFDSQGGLVELDNQFHAGGDWDNWPDETRLKKFDVVLTNPPFGEDRAFSPKDESDRRAIECYELWQLYGGKKIDLGTVFLENAYRILDENGRMGIVLSNSIASIDTHKVARKWLADRMRIVAIFDLPPNVFGETGVNTSIIVAYKPDAQELAKLKKENYKIFVRDIKRVGYEVKTSRRIKYFSPVYEIDYETFRVKIDSDGAPRLDEEFTETVNDFREWCLSQEKTLRDKFIGKI